MINKMFIRAPKITKTLTTTSIWTCKPSGTKRVLHIVGEGGFGENQNKVAVENPTYLIQGSIVEVVSGLTNPHKRLITLI